MVPSPLALDPHAGSTPLANQVAGHQNVLSDASGSLVIKPALPREIAFYHLINSSSKRDQVSKLKPFVPRFYGTLRLEGRLNVEGDFEPDESNQADAIPESVVLENLAHEYTHPSILDVKLGQVLAGDDASPEKVVRMAKKAKETTSGETGLQFTGCQTWHAPTGSYILTPRSWGRTIKAEQLPESFTRFFPLPSDTIEAIYVPPTPISSASDTSAASAMPHLPIPPESNAPVAPATPISGGSLPKFSTHAIQPHTLLRVLTLIDNELERLEAVLQHLEARFVGMSILIIYEGEPSRLEDALNRHEAKIAQRALLAAEEPVVEDEEEEDEDLLEEEEEESSTSSDDDDDDGARADARRARRCPPFTLKMIDFAHTKLAEGEGPDEGILKGLDTLRNLIKGRIEQVRKAVSATPA